jgi:hypothetical protein
MRTTFRSLLALAAGVILSFAQEVTRVSDVIYAKHDGVALTMDVFTPAKPNGAAVIKIVSGGWNSNHNGISDGGWPLHGFTTFVVVHGTQPRFHVHEIVADLQRSVRFVRAHAAKFGIDPDKIGVTGSSAGGHLSLMLGTRVLPANPKSKDPVERVSSAVNAVACYYPPVDFLSWAKDGDSKEGIGPLTTRAPAFGPVVTSAEGPSTGSAPRRRRPSSSRETPIRSCRIRRPGVTMPGPGKSAPSPRSSSASAPRMAAGSRWPTTMSAWRNGSPFTCSAGNRRSPSRTTCTPCRARLRPRRPRSKPGGDLRWREVRAVSIKKAWLRLADSSSPST